MNGYIDICQRLLTCIEERGPELVSLRALEDFARVAPGSDVETFRRLKAWAKQSKDELNSSRKESIGRKNNQPYSSRLCGR